MEAVAHQKEQQGHKASQVQTRGSEGMRPGDKETQQRRKGNGMETKPAKSEMKTEKRGGKAEIGGITREKHKQRKKNARKKKNTSGTETEKKRRIQSTRERTRARTGRGERKRERRMSGCPSKNFGEQAFRGTARVPERGKAELTKPDPKHE